ncbi:hypothetical protein DPMN_020687 [Dreissena polymorpha]|uniref:Uncharacterized protein n=1 Tax=Dreissena polymorpha TaxID=45954 RepID=A0A9D4NJC1_DREPO|nr:hypothetical protein DPMN_020687 [Dreissena polymorpha]
MESSLESFRGVAQKWFVDRLRLNVNPNALRRLGKLACLQLAYAYYGCSLYSNDVNNRLLYDGVLRMPGL